MFGGFAEESGPIVFIGGAFMAANEGCSKLGYRRAKVEHRSDALPIHNPARSDDGHVKALHEQPRQRHRAKMVIGSIRVEGAAVSASFPALCDHRVNARLDRAFSLSKAGRGCDQKATGIL